MWPIPTLFLAAIAALYVAMSVCWLDGRSVSTSFNEYEMLRKMHYIIILVFYALCIIVHIIHYI